ncbi:MAG: Isopentenyl-diphosphate Delta-isomerase [Candidatus Roizmanbacteria bacterium GW2011_GWB1_40_7]|uniref:Isopentenyl-diphosphate Delta-isomerase n=3 Tax=Candidatus Roizmaniibacteriota TaxID=1752723 RepID=A0A0G0XAI0_9BACT|nr:MAG: Isopentenyl-diphosphate Delta-isomerase [Candidatus Levybacteria bacterium GW2011_GWA2_40_16]KKR72254.1 MAG: Isopentenyl-diphosphate Delta-isomerase [Candidatus Roizmanbacteria bacterium GW2011_GWB1_40_7]KKR95061.1 MAG: Isopentenyl-diphosphate Delta-isomerase [Candidatus Roizmanbacteria bacterium GW2011_GWA1_41_13]KKS21950.1 MAG: Isopentenyl-diphosphate Delta-isomerase [Candidatus Roizmanbacteria bacterium GW2011_GWC2_41_7]
MQNYYDKTIFIPTVSKTGEITGQIERWEAHKKGILHKAFSVALFLENQIILQVRKHPVFDGIIDVTASSHPEMKDGKMEDEKEAVIRCLKREWHVEEKDIHDLKDLGSVYYRAKDPKSDYIEHEYCTFYVGKIEKMVSPDTEFAYGYSLVDLNFLKKNPQSFNLAPWVIKAFQDNLFY